MAKDNPGHKNIKPIRTTERAKELGSKGGKATVANFKNKTRQFQALRHMLGIKKRGAVTIEEMKEAIELVWAADQHKINELVANKNTPLFILAAIKECSKASSTALNRILGCPTQRIESTGKDGEPMEVRTPLNISKDEIVSIIKDLNDKV